MPQVRVLTEDDVTKVFLKKETTKQVNPGKSGVTEYPILEFDERALGLLHMGVKETLKYSKIKPAGGKGYLFCKRAFDIFSSALGLLVLAIPMGIVALIIFLDDHGNPLFSQVRIGQNGKPFKFYKFRSMRVDAEKQFANKLGVDRYMVSKWERGEKVLSPRSAEKFYIALRVPPELLLNEELDDGYCEQLFEKLKI